MKHHRTRIEPVQGQGWALYDSDGELVGVYETRKRAREFAEAIKAREMDTEPTEDGVTEPDDDSWTGWPLGKPNPG